MAIRTQGSNLYVFDDANCAVVMVGCVTSMDIDSTDEQIETTCLSNRTRTYEAGLTAGGTLNFQINIDPQDQSHAKLFQYKLQGKTLRFALGWADGENLHPTANTTICDFDLPSARSWILFEGYISNFSFGFASNNVVVSSLSAVISGQPVLLPKNSMGTIWYGRGGFFSNLDPAAGKVFTTAEGNVKAVNPGDPVGRVEPEYGNLVLKQPSSPLRPVLATLPLTGVRNRLQNSMAVGASVELNKIPDGWEVISIPGVSVSVVGYDSMAGSVQLRVHGTPTTPGNLTVGVSLVTGSRIPTSSGTPWRGQLRIRRIAGTLDGIGSMRLRMYDVPSFAQNSTPISLTDSLTNYQVARASASDATAVQLRVEVAGLTVGTPIDLTYEVVDAQLEQRVFTPLQRTKSFYEVREDGVENEWFLHSNGTQWMTFGTSVFGSASLVAVNGQQWTVGASSVSLGAADKALIARGTTPSYTYAMTRLASSPNSIARAVRSAVTAVGTGLSVNDGQIWPEYDTWDGSQLTINVKGQKLPYAFVGNAAGQSTPITVFCINGNSPTAIWNGYANKILFIDKKLSDEELIEVTA